MTEQTSYATILALYYRHQGNKVSASSRAGETPESQKSPQAPQKDRPRFPFHSFFSLLSPQPFFFLFTHSLYTLLILSQFSPLLAAYSTFLPYLYAFPFSLTLFSSFCLFIGQYLLDLIVRSSASSGVQTW